MEFDRPLVPALFVRRDNRFRVTVSLHGAPVAAHLPNSGRLGELLVAGNSVWLRPADQSGSRLTQYDLLLVDQLGTLVSVDARLPNLLVHEALKQKRLPELAGYARIRSEVQRGSSRLDFLLEDRQDRCWMETKSVTLVDDGVARFPDAPTQRGTRHLHSLERAVHSGDRAMIVFIVQRGDASAFGPHAEADPAFCEALRHASETGVEVFAYGCKVELSGVELGQALPVILGTG